MPPGFLRFWWGEAVSGFGGAITALALQTLVVITLQGGAVQVGWLNSALFLPYLVLGLVVGALVDRARRRPVMVATDIARAVLLALIPLAWVLDLLTFPLLLVVVVLFGTRLADQRRCLNVLRAALGAAGSAATRARSARRC